MKTGFLWLYVLSYHFAYQSFFADASGFALKTRIGRLISIVKQDAGFAHGFIKPLTLLSFIEITKGKRVETFQTDGHDSFFSRN
jgi:hypothetical protein